MIAVLLSLLLALVSANSPPASPIDEVAPLVIEGDQVNRMVTTHPGEPDVMVASPDSLYRLVDSSWERMGSAPAVGQIVGGGGDSMILLAGDHPACMRGGASIPLQQSTDGGVTWVTVDGATDVRPLAIWPDLKLALASSCSGLQMSRDGGITWAAVSGVEPGWDLSAFAEIPQAAGEGPLVLLGLTGEGGTSSIVRIDFTSPDAPIVSDPLREYFAIGALAGFDDTYLLAAMDGVWVSTDAGSSWERHAEGLESVVLEGDPLVDGLPEDLDPNQAGLGAVALVPGAQPGLVVGSVDGLYLTSSVGGAWTKIAGTSGDVTQVLVSPSGDTVYYQADGVVSAAMLGDAA